MGEFKLNQQKRNRKYGCKSSEIHRVNLNLTSESEEEWKWQICWEKLYIA